jgi:hypothetical protein
MRPHLHTGKVTTTEAEAMNPIDTKTRGVLKGTFLTLSLLCLAAGTTFLTVIWFVDRGTRDTDYLARGLSFIVIWPLTLLSVLVLGSAALITARRLATVPLYAALWVGVVIASWATIIDLINLPAVVFLIFALAINVAAVLIVRRVFYSTSAEPMPEPKLQAAGP